jgi:hypothetical protein
MRCCGWRRDKPIVPARRENADRDQPLPIETNDGTRELVRGGGAIFGTGVLAGVLLLTILGGFTRTGATTNTGWFALIVTLMCLPFGGMLLALGVAKWVRRRRMRARGQGY